MLGRHGHDALHTRDLADQNATSDSVINRVSIAEQRVVISKDSDFFYSHLLHGCPWKLLLVRTGNISARDLFEVFERNLQMIEDALQKHTLVELDRIAVTPMA
jgi:predicted nuclease of predicted toxin-antitoxin system